MNVATHQETEKNEKTVKRKAGVKRRQANFKEAACYPFVVIQGAARQKNAFCEGNAQGNWDLTTQFPDKSSALSQLIVRNAPRCDCIGIVPRKG